MTNSLKYFFICALITFQTICTQAFAQVSEDEDLSSRVVHVNKKEHPKVEQFLQLNSHINNVEIREFDLTKLKLDKNKLKFRLPSGEKVEFIRTMMKATSSGGLLWHGEAKEGGEVTLVLSDNSLHGIIQYEQRHFYISKVDDKYYAFYEVPQEAFPKKNDEEAITEIDCSAPLNIELAVDPSCQLRQNFDDASINTASVSSHSNIRVLGVYTTATKNDLGGDANSVVRLELMANQLDVALVNNGINGNMSVDYVGSEFVEYQEASSHEQIISDLKNNPKVIAMREYYGADIVAIMVSNREFCGLAERLGANTDSAFFTVLNYCTNFTFPHEFAHLLGARHNPEEDGGGTFNHGYLDKVNGFRTIMSYDGDPACCARINYFSTPGQFYNGNVIGTSNKHDNERQLLSYAATAAAFKSKTTAGIDAPALTVTSAACYGQNTMRWSEEWGKGNVTYKVYRSNYSDMTSKTLHGSYSSSGSSFVNLSNAYDRPYFAAEACDLDGCSNLSPIKRAQYLNVCR